MQRGTSAMSKQSYAGIIDVRVGEQMTGDGDYKSPLTPCARKFVLEKTSKAIVFSHLDDMITVGLNNGGLYLFDLRADTTEPVTVSRTDAHRVSLLYRETSSTTSTRVRSVTYNCRPTGSV
jgi:hypothetical protein